MKVLLILSVLGTVHAADYAGAEVCRKCHATEYDRQSNSAHSHTLARSNSTQPGEWAFGSGTQAITFLTRTDREHYREHGETWYRSVGGFGVTPGQTSMAGVEFRIFDPDARILRCFACHSTGPLTLGAEDQIEPHELGVRCEVCHGPGAAHAANPAAVRPRNPSRLPATEMNALCAMCHHITLETGDEAKDLRDPRNLRSEPLRLAASACFQRSKGRLNCITCHSPHDPLETKAAAYDAACRNCHAAQRHTAALGPRPCVECHMPAVREGNLVFANHRIATYRPQDPLIPVASRPRR